MNDESVFVAYGRLIGQIQTAYRQAALDFVKGFNEGSRQYYISRTAAAVEDKARRKRINDFDVETERARLDDLGRRIQEVRSRW